MACPILCAHLVVHYGEIGTKGNNRPTFERFLANNISANLHNLRVSEMTKLNQRFILRVEDPDVPAALTRLKETFGVSWFAPVRSVELSYEKLAQAVVEELAQRSTAAGTFRITPKRSDKSFPLTSSELARRLGADAVSKTGSRVDLSNPATNIRVDLLSDRGLVYSEKHKGLGGLPVGVSGSAVHLLSGGIDSPAAAWLMMKRGCRLIYLHFFAGRDPAEVLDSKILQILKILSKYGGKSMLILLPFAPYQVASAAFPQDHEPIIFRAFMRRVAELMAGRFGATAISTGDSLGQVASQTLFNLAQIDRGQSLPVLRPLIAYDKTEIVDLAISIGTYSASIQAYHDCCVLISRHPKTRAVPETVLAHLEKLEMDRLTAALTKGGRLVAYDPKSQSLTVQPLNSDDSVSPPSPHEVAVAVATGEGTGPVSSKTRLPGRD